MAVDEQEPSVRTQPFEYTSRFVAKINNRRANMFTGRQAGGYGTGFLAEIRTAADGRKIGVIWTNKHVIASDSNSVQNVTVEFSTDTDIPEVVEAEIVFSSPINDFAVLEFPMESLKRVREKLKPANLPTRNSMFYDFRKFHRELRGVETLAQGNPLSTEAVTTYGRINGISTDFVNGDYIQTQTPINPGNSGGPLIELEQGLVIGINSAILLNAQNVGYALPIGVVMDEYQAWRKDPRVGRHLDWTMRLNRSSISDLKIANAYKPIEDQYPEFFTKYNGTLIVDDVDNVGDKEAGLQVGDQIVKVAGEFCPPSVYEIRKRLQMRGSPLEFEVVRGGKLIKRLVHAADTTYFNQRRAVDFVSFAGLIFREFSEPERWWYDHGLKSQVILSLILQTPETRFSIEKIPDVESLLVGVQIEGTTYPIHRLQDLKVVLRRHSKAKFIRLDVREPNKVRTSEGLVPFRDRFGFTNYSITTASYNVPVLDLLTPRDISLNRFAKNYSFDEDKPETRDWRSVKRPRVASVTRTPCEEVLADPGSEAISGQ